MDFNRKRVFFFSLTQWKNVHQKQYLLVFLKILLTTQFQLLYDVLEAKVGGFGNLGNLSCAPDSVSDILSRFRRIFKINFSGLG